MTLQVHTGGRRPALPAPARRVPPAFVPHETSCPAPAATPSRAPHGVPRPDARAPRPDARASCADRVPPAFALVIALLAAALTALVLLAGCSGSAGATGAATAAGATGAAFDPPDKPAMPKVDEDGPAIDASHVEDGYVVARTSSASRLKFQVSKDDAVYNYDLPNDGTATVFPLNMGDGTYLFRIMKNTSGNDYVEQDREEVQVKLASEFAPFLIPNQFCSYTRKSECVKKARELTDGAQNQGEAVKAICDFVTSSVSYDSAKAEKLATETGYIPDPDDTMATGTGVCFDYASLGAAMLRSLGFPTKIITGYVSPGDLYHAWIMVYVDGSWQTGEFSVSPDTWSRVDLTFAASGESEFVGDGTSYVERYVY